jgi:stage III sporulation protein AB
MAGCGALGLYFAAREGLRVRDLQELKKALLILRQEIDYMRTPLTDACAGVARRVEGGISQLFADFAGALGAAGSDTAYRHWACTVEAAAPAMFLSREDLQAMDGFGKTLGYLDKQMQLAAIGHATSYIDSKIVSIQTAAQKNTRMYRSLGIIGGLLVCVVLW